MSVLDGVTWNAHVGRADELRDVVTRLANAAGHPTIITLHEVWQWGGTIPGYRRVQANPRRFPHRESRNTIHLVRRQLGTVRLTSSARQPGDAVWVGPHGREHAPRTFLRQTVLHDGRRWDVVGVHRAWVGNGAAHDRNARAWVQEHDGLVRWADDRNPRVPFIMPGDWNPGGMKGTRFSVDQLARAIGGDVKLRGPDGVIARGCQLRNVERLDRTFGSDHHPVRWEAVA